MSIRIKSCIVIVCDGCGDGAEHEDGMTPHFDTLDEATVSLAGDGDDEDFTHEWLMTPAEHICPRCRAKRACAVVGHDLSDWATADARGIPMARRFCYRCNFYEVAPATEESR